MPSNTDLILIPESVSSPHRIQMASSFYQANTLIFCHGRRNCRMGGSARIWQCRDQAEYDLVGETIQDQELLQSVLNATTCGQVRYWTLDLNAATEPHEQLDMMCTAHMDAFFARLRDAATTPRAGRKGHKRKRPPVFKHIVFMSCPVANRAKKILIDFTTLWQVLQRCFSFFNEQNVQGWRIVVTNFFTSFNTSLLDSIAEKGIQHNAADLLAAANATLHTSTESGEAGGHANAANAFARDLHARFSTEASHAEMTRYVNATQRKRFDVQCLAQYLRAYSAVVQQVHAGPLAARKNSEIVATLVSLMQLLSIPVNVVKPAARSRKPSAVHTARRSHVIRSRIPASRRRGGATKTRYFHRPQPKQQRRTRTPRPESTPILFEPLMQPLYIPETKWLNVFGANQPTVYRGRQLGMVFRAC
jgi:hypothetical protein